MISPKPVQWHDISRADRLQDLETPRPGLQIPLHFLVNLIAMILSLSFSIDGVPAAQTSQSADGWLSVFRQWVPKTTLMNVAQWVEHQIVSLTVTGSTPVNHEVG